MSELSFVDRAEIEQELRTRVQQDTAFLEHLRLNAREALEQQYPQWFSQGTISQETQITILEEDAHHLYLVFPTIGSKSFSDVPEDQLRGVQGGGLGQIAQRIRAGKGKHQESETLRNCNTVGGHCYTRYDLLGCPQ